MTLSRRGEEILWRPLSNWETQHRSLLDPIFHSNTSLSVSRIYYSYCRMWCLFKLVLQLGLDSSALLFFIDVSLSTPIVFRFNALAGPLSSGLVNCHISFLLLIYTSFPDVSFLLSALTNPVLGSIKSCDPLGQVPPEPSQSSVAVAETHMGRHGLK